MTLNYDFDLAFTILILWLALNVQGGFCLSKVSFYLFIPYDSDAYLFCNFRHESVSYSKANQSIPSDKREKWRKERQRERRLLKRKNREGRSARERWKGRERKGEQRE